MNEQTLTLPSVPKKLMRQVFCGMIVCMLTWVMVPNASAALSLPEPDVLIQEAQQGKNQLRDVINQIDQNLVEIRDAETFDRYFAILDALQVIADDLGLDTIYPDGVKKLGHRMVQKGVNWLNLRVDSIDKMLAYHQWMSEPQPAYTAMYSFEIQLKDIKQLKDLESASMKLERLLVFVTQQWPTDTSLHRLYRDLLSDVAVKSLKNTSLTNEQILFWVTKIYRPEALLDVAIKFQDQMYQITAETKTELHLSLERIYQIFLHSQKLDPGSSESLRNQIGDNAVDLFLRSIRFEENLNENEFNQVMMMFSKRHYISLANAWALYDKVPHTDFAVNYIEKSFIFTKKLREVGLSAEAETLSRAIRSKASAILARSLKLEGFWEMKDRRGKKWALNIIYAADGMIFVDLTGPDQMSYPFFYVIYDMDQKGFLAALRAPDADINSNVPVRFFPQPDGTLKVVNMISPEADMVMIAKRIQTYPDLMAQREIGSAVDFNGVYQGILKLDKISAKKVELSIATFNDHAIGNMKHPSFFATFNFGSNGKDNVIYLTRGNNKVLGSWMHLRLKMDDKNNLVGYLIDGATGLNPNPIQLKKIANGN